MTTNNDEKKLHNISEEDKNRYTKSLDKLLEHHHAEHSDDSEEHKNKREHIEKVVKYAKGELETGKLTHEVKTFLEHIEDDIHEAEPALVHVASLVTLYANALGFV